MFGRRAIVCHKSIDLSLKVSCQNSCIMAEYIAAGIQMQQYAHRDDSVMFRDDMEEGFSRSPVETYTECLALSLFIDKQAGTLNLRMSHKTMPKSAQKLGHLTQKLAAWGSHAITWWSSRPALTESPHQDEEQSRTSLVYHHSMSQRPANRREVNCPGMPQSALHTYSHHGRNSTRDIVYTDSSWYGLLHSPW